MIAAESSARRNRWAVSFADLLLLLLGFFVLLQASGQRRDAMLAGVRQQFGGRQLSLAVEIRADALFQPGEALLTEGGKARLVAAVRGLAASQGQVEIHSLGTDPVHQRFDQWDLAAARLGAVARALEAQGLARDRLIIRGLDQSDELSSKGQIIRIGAGKSVRR